MQRIEVFDRLSRHTSAYCKTRYTLHASDATEAKFVKHAILKKNRFSVKTKQFSGK